MIVNSPVIRSNDNGRFLVRFYDYDGTLLKKQYVASGGSAIAPTNPSHTGLTFQGWDRTFSNVTRQLDVGATYTVTDGKTHAYIRVSVVTGLDAAFYVYKSDASTLTLDWGDGTTSTTTAVGAIGIGAHTYADYGDYEVTLWISSGSGNYSLGFNQTGYTFCGAATQNRRDMLTKLLIGDNVPAITQYGVYSQRHLRTIMVPTTVTSIGNYGLADSWRLEAALLPAATTLGTFLLANAYALPTVVFSQDLTAIPASAFGNALVLRNIVIPPNVVDIGASAFTGCTELVDTEIPTGVTTIGASAFNGCYALDISLTLPNLSSLGASAFYICRSIRGANLTGATITSLLGSCFYSCAGLTSVVFPTALTSFVASSFVTSGVKTITIPANVTSIANQTFHASYNTEEYILVPTTPPTLAAVDGIYVTANTRIYVPDASVAAYKVATNWITLANYIYSINDR